MLHKQLKTLLLSALTRRLLAVMLILALPLLTLAGPLGAAREGAQAAASTPTLVHDLKPGPRSADEPVLRPVATAGGILFYVIVSSEATSLWRSDGTPAGTWLLQTYPLGASLWEFTTVGENLFFTTSNVNLWRSAGNAKSVTLVKTLSAIYRLTSALGALYFQGEGSIWRSDGTPEGTRPLVEPAANQAQQWRVTPPMQAAGTREAIFFTQSGLNFQTELWRSDGSSAGTTIVKRFAQPACNSRNCWDEAVEDLVATDSQLFFSARLPGGTKGLWRSDGRPEGTVELSGRTPFMLTTAGAKAFFVLEDIGGMAELWRSDGTPAGTLRLAGPFLKSALEEPTAAEDRLFFTLADGGMRLLWISDGTAAGTHQVARFQTESATTLQLAGGGGAAYFSASTPEAGAELWTSDGTATGTGQVIDLAPGPNGSHPSGLMAAGPRLFFQADDGEHGAALWTLPLTSLPYEPGPLVFSATVEAERYDRGGEEVAYHDADALNQRPSFRPDQAVDVEAWGDGKYMVGWTRAGEWLNYTLEVAATRTYTLEVRVAALGAGGTFHLSLDGANWSGPLQIPDTGGWTQWATLRKAGLTLPAGRHTLRLVFDQDGGPAGAGNIDRFVLRAPPENAVLIPQVGR